jgi:hypothetical protein
MQFPLGIFGPRLPTLSRLLIHNGSSSQLDDFIHDLV